MKTSSNNTIISPVFKNTEKVAQPQLSLYDRSMKTNKRDATVTLDRTPEFRAVTIGAKISGFELSPRISQDIARAQANWTHPAVNSSWERKGLISYFRDRTYPDVVIGSQEFMAVEFACAETAAVRGIYGAYYKVRGYRKAACSIMSGIKQVDDLASSK